MAGLKFVQPGQQYIAAEIRRRRKLQNATDCFSTAGKRLRTVAQAGERRTDMAKVQLAFRREPQAASRAYKQSRAESTFESFEGGARHGRRNVQRPGGGGQASIVCSADEQLQVVDAQHFQNPIERASLITLFFRRVKQTSITASKTEPEPHHESSRLLPVLPCRASASAAGYRIAGAGAWPTRPTGGSARHLGQSG